MTEFFSTATLFLSKVIIIKMKRISRDKLEKLYQENETYKLAKMLKVSVPTLMRYLRNGQIPNKKKQGIRATKFRIVD